MLPARTGTGLGEQRSGAAWHAGQHPVCLHVSGTSQLPGLALLRHSPRAVFQGLCPKLPLSPPGEGTELLTKNCPRTGGWYTPLNPHGHCAPQLKLKSLCTAVPHAAGSPVPITVRTRAGLAELGARTQGLS